MPLCQDQGECHIYVQLQVQSLWSQRVLTYHVSEMACLHADADFTLVVIQATGTQPAAK